MNKKVINPDYIVTILLDTKHWPKKTVISIIIKCISIIIYSQLYLSEVSL
jgi:hypothetical protein